MWKGISMVQLDLAFSEYLNTNTLPSVCHTSAFIATHEDKSEAIPVTLCNPFTFILVVTSSLIMIDIFQSFILVIVSMELRHYI